jgi:AcrR family transcriptional regulator
MIRKSEAVMTPPDSPLQKARREAYRQVILDAAERVFADYGFEAARIQAIADEAGVSVGTVYSVFGSKSELFSSVLTCRLPEMLEAIHAAAINAPTTFEKLTEGLDAFIVYMLEHPAYLQIHLRESSWGFGPTRASSEQVQAWRDGLELEAAILQDAMDEGIVIKEDAVRLTRAIMAMHQVQLWDWVEKGMKEPPEEVAPRIRRLLVQMICIDRGQE